MKTTIETTTTTTSPFFAALTGIKVKTGIKAGRSQEQADK